mmetsp:Transcript_17692/g.41949  ORF Transcript_17692/g.41949 Transcript_17692/m.41949 type:complete len:205 (+) Transcript_17692:166-780(+)
MQLQWPRLFLSGALHLSGVLAARPAEQLGARSGSAWRESDPPPSRCVQASRARHIALRGGGERLVFAVDAVGGTRTSSAQNVRRGAGASCRSGRRHSHRPSSRATRNSQAKSVLSSRPTALLPPAPSSSGRSSALAARRSQGWFASPTTGCPPANGSRTRSAAAATASWRRGGTNLQWASACARPGSRRSGKRSCSIGVLRSTF